MTINIVDFIMTNLITLLATIGGAIAWVLKFQADSRSRKLEEVNILLQTHKTTAQWFSDQLDNTRERYEEVLAQIEKLREDNHKLMDSNRELIRLNIDLKKRIQELEEDFMKLSARIPERIDNAPL